MKWIVPISLISALSLAGCAMTAAANCAGWKKPPKPNDPVSLAVKEEPIARYLVATDRYGKSQRCWN